MMTWLTAIAAVAFAVLATPVAFALYFLHRRGLLRYSDKSRILQEERPSFTAELVCIYRAVCTSLGYCDDPFAFYILDHDARLFTTFTVGLRRLTGYTLARRMVNIVATRTVYLDRFIHESKAEQVVILGAGLDARAFRMRELIENGVKFFEVDAPASQNMKVQVMKTLLKTNPELFPEPNYSSYVTFVPCDFSSESFLAKLKESGFDSGNPRTVILMEGVASYLTKEALSETLKSIGGLAPGTRFAMNIVGESTKGRVVGKKLLKNVAGEEPKNKWRESDNPDEFFGAYGFVVLGARTFQDVLEKEMPIPKSEVAKDPLDSYIFTLQVK